MHKPKSRDYTWLVTSHIILVAENSRKATCNRSEKICINKPINNIMFD